MIPERELQRLTPESGVCLGRTATRLRTSCAGPVRIVDGRDSAEADARSDQLRMLDRAGF